MKIRLISFTDRGEELARRLGELLPGESMRCNCPLPLGEWTEAAFREAEGLIFVGAVGIGVRAVAPYVTRKDRDPAVVVVDETGRFAVSLLSGHLGGANDLARRVAGICGGIPVITTATDQNGVFPVDQWARIQGCAVVNPERIKGVSAALLSGKTIRVRSDWYISGLMPEGVQMTAGKEFDVLLSAYRSDREALYLAPKVVALGVGCRRGTGKDELEQCFRTFCDGSGILPEAISQVCSIDIKAGEAGLSGFCQDRNLPLRTFSAEELQSVPGVFTPSEFVKEITGVDNVCERSAVLGSGGGLIQKKTAGNGVTMAAAMAPFAPDWRWQDG